MNEINLKNVFMDDESKMIYEYRHLFNQTGNLEYINKMCNLVLEYRNIDFESRWKKYCKKNLVIFGCGAISEELYKILKLSNKEVDYFCDNNKERWGKRFIDKEVISPSQLKEIHKDSSIIIGTSIPTYIKQIKEQLFQMGFTEDDILFSCDDIGRQYFDLPELQLKEIEYFVDAGSFNGDDTLNFLKYCKNSKGIYIFEPDEKNLNVCKKRLSKVENIELYPYGLWNKRENISFSAGKSGSSRIQYGEDDMIECISLDEILDQKEVSYIKMDIEGAEMNALVGARDTIKHFRPKLAICVYHEQDDIYRIPEYLLKLIPDYQLYLRHYSMGTLETVLYAI